ncbi:hypothetical protein [Roseiconus lacunae]|uniref:hypothetical protein n=1 Tax=Roseiconus lacunae TaxID=2605694 RepID=UPI001E3B903F|nr:hypothetical protein [Roseiconus lacunae]MCD0457890.1 hypothetical protein [Roseiconus lacunae]
MSSISDVTALSLDAAIDYQDYDPLFSMLNAMSSAGEAFVDWYEGATDRLDEGVGWMNWFTEKHAGGGHMNSNYDAEVEQDLADFTNWLRRIDFDYEKYFYVSSDYDYVNDQGEFVFGIRSGTYEVEEITELLALEVDQLSSFSEQTSLYTNAVIESYGEVVDELMNIIDNQRRSSLSHLRR